MAANQIGTVIGALIFVLLILFATAWLAKRNNWISKRNKQIDLQIIGSQSLGARNSIAAIKVENTCLIVGITPQNINLLHSLPLDEQTGPDFAKVLDHAKQ